MGSPVVAVHDFSALGSRCRVVVAGPPGLADRAEARVGSIERTWSRFRSDSEVSQVNARPGTPVVVSDATRDLFTRAAFARTFTGGLFDPMVLDSMVAAGYDRDHRDLPPANGSAEGAECRGPTTGSFRIDGDTVTVLGGRFDPGGLGKGLAADLVAEELIGAGATGCYLDLGGDIRFAGRPIDGANWSVHVDDPFGDAPVLTLGLPSGGGGVATSSVLRRRWHHAGTDRHHVIDPRTGAPTATEVVAVTVVAGETWWAEVLAKAAIVAGRDAGRALMGDAGVAAVMGTSDGVRTIVGDPGEVNVP